MGEIGSKIGEDRPGSGRTAPTLAQYTIPQLPDAENLFGMVQVTQDLYIKLAGLHVRRFASLGQATWHVETALGLPVLPEPDFDGQKKTPPTDEE